MVSVQLPWPRASFCYSAAQQAGIGHYEPRSAGCRVSGQQVHIGAVTTAGWRRSESKAVISGLLSVEF